MPDLSAGRPLLPAEKIQGFTVEDASIVARAIGADYWIPSDRSAAARAVLTALTAAGRLLPPDAEHLQRARLVTGDDGVQRLQERSAWVGPWVEVDRSETP